jgi:hypothetical protein
MDNQQYTYRCPGCDKTVSYSTKSVAPTCCDREMVREPLPYCTSADHAEMVRNEDAGEPCDDGRADTG